MEKTQSLDDTLKELLEESSDEVKEATESAEKKSDNNEEKPKRTRRTKAQIEADEKAAAEASKASDEPKEDDTSDKSEILEPEVVPDTAEDKNPDVDEVVEFEVNPAEEQGEPEVVLDTEVDNMPDIQDPPNQEKPKTVHPRGEAVAAFKDKENEAKSEWIGKQIILTHSTPTFRAKHVNFQAKSYKGLVTIIEEPSSGFVKVQFLRQGFGLCESYMLLDHLIPKEDDFNEETTQ